MTIENDYDPGDLEADHQVHHDKPSSLRLNRRDFVVGGTSLGLGSAALYMVKGRPASAEFPCDPDPTTTTTVSPTTDPPLSVTTTTQGPGTTGGTVPSGAPWSSVYSQNEGDVVISSHMILDVDAKVKSLKIEAAGRLTMAPGSSVTLTSAGNVVVLGELVMKPSSAGQVHRVHFDSVNESAYKGGGMEILSSDVGLWIADHGLLSASGAAKNPWTRATGSLSKGSNKVNVEDARGWNVGDEVTITATIAPTKDTGQFHQNNENALAYDTAKITAVNGNEVSLDKSMQFDHPMMSLTQWDGQKRNYGAEVLNLTRNVIVSGTDQGKAHVIFIHCDQPQMLDNVQFDRLGPRQASAGNKKRTSGVTGRYPFHMHHCGDGSRGSVIKDCLVTRSGNRAYVPHESHGVALDGCVAHDIHGSAFWWDQPGRHNPTGEHPVTHDALWTRCVASYVWADQKSDNGYRMGGFVLAEGNENSNKLFDSVAVGVFAPRVPDNTSNRSGFHWPEHGQAVWDFKNCLAHNIAGNGILTWQNRELVHVIEDFTAYHCASHGVEHGAYSNFYRYERMTLVANRLSGVGLHAVTRRTNSVRRNYTDKGKPAPILHFKDVLIDGRGLTVDGVRSLSHRFAAKQPDGPAILENFTVTGTTRCGLYETKGKNAPYYILKNWKIDSGMELVMLDSGAPSKIRIDVEGVNGDGKKYTLGK